MWKREQVKEKGDGQKNDKENIVDVVDGDMGIVYNDSSINTTRKLAVDVGIKLFWAGVQ